jgi:ABC-2 type transport system permease protein
MGVILTMTMVMTTGLAMTCERERHHEPARDGAATEQMTGKIVPIHRPGPGDDHPAGRALPVRRALRRQRSRALRVSLPFIAANLTVGITISSIAQNQLQAMQ